MVKRKSKIGHFSISEWVMNKKHSYISLEMLTHIFLSSNLE